MKTVTESVNLRLITILLDLLSISTISDERPVYESTGIQKLVADH